MENWISAGWYGSRLTGDIAAAIQVHYTDECTKD